MYYTLVFFIIAKSTVHKPSLLVITGEGRGESITPEELIVARVLMLVFEFEIKSLHAVDKQGKYEHPEHENYHPQTQSLSMILVQ